MPARADDVACPARAGAWSPESRPGSWCRYEPGPVFFEAGHTGAKGAQVLGADPPAPLPESMCAVRQNRCNGFRQEQLQRFRQKTSQLFPLSSNGFPGAL